MSHAQGYLGKSINYVLSTVKNDGECLKVDSSNLTDPEVPFILVEGKEFMSSFYFEDSVCVLTVIIPLTETFNLQFFEMLKNDKNLVKLSNNQWTTGDYKRIITYKWSEDFKRYIFVFKNRKL